MVKGTLLLCSLATAKAVGFALGLRCTCSYHRHRVQLLKRVHGPQEDDHQSTTFYCFYSSGQQVRS